MSRTAPGKMHIPNKIKAKPNKVSSPISHAPHSLPLRKAVRGVVFFVLWLCAGMLLPSCQKGTEYHQFRRTDNRNWSKQDTLHFEIPVTDTLFLHQLAVEVRHNVQYPYREILLAIETDFCDSRGRHARPETHLVRYRLTDPQGEWLGEGWGSQLQTAHTLRRLCFPRSGTLHCKIYHRMNAASLPGIEDIGLHLSLIHP